MKHIKYTSTPFFGIPTKGILLFAMVFSFWQCKSDAEKEEPQSAESSLVFVPMEQWKANDFQLIALQYRGFAKTVEVSGMVEAPPEQQAVLTSMTGGHLQGFSLLEGQFVRKGQRLMSLENPELVGLQRNYLEVSRQLNYLKSEMERQKQMYDEKISAGKNYLKAKSDYETALATYHGLRKELSVMGINPGAVSNGNIQSVVGLYAPISGYITEILAVKGAYVSPQTELVKIVNSSNLHLELKVFEKDAMQLKEGQLIRFKVPEASDNEYDAEVHLISNMVNEDRTVQVHAQMKDPEIRLFPGMFIDAKIVLQSKNEGSLPETALAEVESKMFAMQFVKKDKKGYYFKAVELKAGSESDNYRAIDQTTPANAQYLNKEVFSFL